MMNRASEDIAFWVGDLVSMQDASGWALIVGGSFSGPPSFTGVIYVYSHEKILAVNEDEISSVVQSIDRKEIEYI